MCYSVNEENCYMASIDLIDAYYAVPVAVEHRRYLRFLWRNRLFQYTCLPNGLVSALRYFTKLLKPVYSTLLSQGYLNVGYIDDSYLQGDSNTECRSDILTTLSLFEPLGFLINHEKSTWKYSLQQKKRERIILACQQILKRSVISIRKVAHVIGLLHYRSLEIDKNTPLQQNNGNYEAIMTLSSESVNDLSWWVTSLPIAWKILPWAT